ncbi:NAD(P)H-dependent oxidoreductase [Hahella sp. CCB-MM4]|uniref:NAD(P)H-dependent oxidoreductase n=1 Tax=Hahella sp. (strain CCB-MM4) TaxID=1926491 RepID=UPI000B9A37C3|nr:NAD(P)H-dependent oxidoreductase [Hahella sp. CCB-MM4]OZG71820.1 NAD(P)H-dependent oxidoreductase [Hahella sp. CCB-MM4]
MNITEALNWRYATKRMNGHKIPTEKLNRILDAARLAPSSYGLQPYSVLVIEDEALREKISAVAYNQPQIMEASHLLVFAAMDSVDTHFVEEFIDLTALERGISADSMEDYKNTIIGAVNSFATNEERFHWAAKQAYISLGTTIAAAAAEQVDASPMEGFDPKELDILLGLKERGLRSVLLLPLGYRNTNADWLAGMKKVRWPRDKMFIRFPRASSPA